MQAEPTNVFARPRGILSSAFAVVWLGACTPMVEEPAPRNPPPPDAMARTAADGKPIRPTLEPSPVALDAEPSSAAEPSPPARAARATQSTHAGILFEGVAWDERLNRLIVVDQAGGPGSRHADAAAAGSARGGVAAVNAGFFTPAGEPLGLVVADGTQAGSWNAASSLGSGLWLRKANGNSSIARRETIGKAGAAAMRELLQAGPMLVEHGRAVSGLDTTKPAVRMVLLWDGNHRWWIGRAGSCTLASLASALAGGGPAGWPVRHALNLDGGFSTDLWISGNVTGGPIVRRPPWNRQVRNFMVLLPR
jgi:hypothetical protein